MLTPDKVKPFILHEDRIVRNFAVEYFEEGHIYDEDIMPLILQSYRQEKNKEKATTILLRSVEFPQSPETLERIMRHITNSETNRYLLEKIVAYTDLNLLKQFEGRARLSFSSLNKILKDRRKLAETGTDELWTMLWNHSEYGSDEENNDFSYEYGKLIVRELVKREDVPINSIMEKLQTEQNGYHAIYLCRIIGMMKIKEGIPFLLENLREDSDVQNEEALEALSRLGTEEVVNTLHDCFLNETKNFRLYGGAVFSNIKLPASEKALLDILPQEKDVSIATSLAVGLCRVLSVEGIPLVINLITNGCDEMHDIIEDLYANCIINGVTLPDMEKLKGMTRKLGSDVLSSVRKFRELYLPELHFGRDD